MKESCLFWINLHREIIPENYLPRAILEVSASSLKVIGECNFLKDTVWDQLGPLRGAGDAIFVSPDPEKPTAPCQDRPTGAPARRWGCHFCVPRPGETCGALPGPAPVHSGVVHHLVATSTAGWMLGNEISVPGWNIIWFSNHGMGTSN